MMAQLIPFEERLIGTETFHTVNARDLHEFLESKQQFSDWIRNRIKQYAFLEDVDFTRYIELCSGNPNPPIEYFLTLDMAKQLSMVERNAQGREARQYFLACERTLRLQASPPPAVPTPHERLLIVQEHVAALTALGILDDRDKMEFGAYIRQSAKAAMQPIMGGAVAPASTEPTLWTVSMRLQYLGYPPLHGAESQSLQIKVGIAVKKAYHQTYRELPKQMWDYVKGQQRQVNAYPPERVGVMDEVLETFFGPPPALTKLVP